MKSNPPSVMTDNEISKFSHHVKGERFSHNQLLYLKPQKKHFPVDMDISTRNQPSYYEGNVSKETSKFSPISTCLSVSFFFPLFREGGGRVALMKLSKLVISQSLPVNVHLRNVSSMQTPQELIMKVDWNKLQSYIMKSVKDKNVCRFKIWKCKEARDRPYSILLRQSLAIYLRQATLDKLPFT